MNVLRAVSLASVLGTTFLQVAPAHACFLGIGCDPTVNGNVNAQVGLEIKGLDQTLDEIDKNSLGLMEHARDALHGENQQIAANVSAETSQIGASIRQQIQQIAGASSDVVNQVSDRVDMQLRALQQQANQALGALNHVQTETHKNVTADLNKILKAEADNLAQIHRDIDLTLNQIGGFLNESANRFYARSQDVADRAHAHALEAVNNAMFLGARAVLLTVMLIALWLVTRQANAYINGGRVGKPIEPIVGGAILLVCLLLVSSKALLAAALGMREEVPDPADVCVRAEHEFNTFKQRRDQGIPPNDLSIAAGELEEDLSHCSYSTLSKERAAAAQRRIADVARTFAPPPTETAVAQSTKKK